MQSHHATPPVEKTEDCPLPFRDEDFETLAALPAFLGTIIFKDNTTIPSPLVIELRKEPSIDLEYCIEILRTLNMARECQKNRMDILAECVMKIPHSEHEKLTVFISAITKCFITYNGTVRHILQESINIVALSELFTVLSYLRLRHYENTLNLIATHTRELSKKELSAASETTQTIIRDADYTLDAALAITRILPKLKEKPANTLVSIIGVGYNIYGLVEIIKSELVRAKNNAPLTRKFTALTFLDKLNELKGSFTLEPEMDLVVAYSAYQNLSRNTKNKKNIDAAYESARDKIKTYFEKSLINESAFRYYTYSISIIRIRDALVGCVLRLVNLEFEAARLSMLEIETLFQNIAAYDDQRSQVLVVTDEPIHTYLTVFLAALEKRILKASASTIDDILSDFELLNRVLEAYQAYAMSNKEARAIYEAIRLKYDNKIAAVKEKAERKKEIIREAQANANKLSEPLDKKTEQNERRLQKILDNLTSETRHKIKSKPKPSKFTPKTQLETDATTTPTVPDNSEDIDPVAEEAKLFFESHPYREYQAFVDKQTAENRARALLYVGDYYSLVNIDKALTIYEIAYTVANEETPPNEGLMTNLTFSLSITREHISAKLANNKKSQAEMDQSRQEYIMYLGYSFLADNPDLVSENNPPLTKQAFHDLAHQHGLAWFKDIGEQKKENNLPLSKYAARRELLAKEIIRLTASNKKAQTLLMKVEGKPEPKSALQQNSLFPQAKPQKKPVKKKRAGVKGRKNNHR